MEECTEMVDSYARMADGPTWETMREARFHPHEVQTTPTEEENGRPQGDKKRRLCELSDALAVIAIEQDTEVQETQSIANALWELLDFPGVDNAHQGKCR